jgi:hypothetical protein
VASPVLDSFAVLVFLFEERGYQKRGKLFEQGADDGEPLFSERNTPCTAAPAWSGTFRSISSL